MFCRLNVAKGTLNVGCIYRSPSSTSVNNNQLLDLISKASNYSKNKLIIVGDFNYRDIDWDTLTCPHNSEHPASKFLKTVQDCYLFQYVNAPTRYGKNQTPSRLDLVFANRPDFVNSIDIDMNIGKSDHITINISLDLSLNQNQQPTHSLNYYKGDYLSMKANLCKIDWQKLFNGKNTEQCWTDFKSILLENVDKHIPKSKPNTSFKNPPLWMNHTAKQAIKAKKKTWRKYNSHQTLWSAKKYYEARNLCANQIRDIKKTFEKKIVNEAKTNPKSFWKYVKSQTKYNESIPKLKNDKGAFVETDIDKAEVLNSFFSSVFTKDDESNPHLPERQLNSLMSDISFTINDVLYELSKINTNKSAGPDELHPRLLYELKNEIALPLHHIFMLSLNESHVPNDWKVAHVVPIFKKGDKSSPGNYRPVSLTSIVCKLFETLIRKQLVDHLESNKLL